MKFAIIIICAWPIFGGLMGILDGNWIEGLFFISFGLILFFLLFQKRKRQKYLKEHGIPYTAKIVYRKVYRDKKELIWIEFPTYCKPFKRDSINKINFLDANTLMLIRDPSAPQKIIMKSFLEE